MTFINYLIETFGIENLGQVKWSHAVNSKKKLLDMLLDPSVMVIESDISMGNNNEVICAHPPDTKSDLSLIQLLNKVGETNKAIKLDFKDPRVIRESLKIIKSLKISNKMLLNADVLQGNGASKSKFDAREFVDICKQEVPDTNLSLGWTSVADVNYPYEMKEIGEMLKLVNNENYVTFPVRACLLPNSWNALKYLLNRNDTWTLSLWNNEPLDNNLVYWIKENTESQKTYYDLIDGNKESVYLM